MTDSGDAGTRHRARWQAWTLAALALVVLAGLGASYVPGFFWEERRVETADETVLYYFAQNLGEPILCDRISWAAYRTYSVFFGGGGASYFRSDCYEQVAQSRHDPSVCWKVRPLVDLDPFSAGYSALACRRRTRAGQHSGIGISDDLLIRTFERAGFGPDRMGKEPGTPPFIRWQDVYRQLEHDSAAIARAEALLAQADGSNDPVERSYLAHLAAMATLDPKWCSSISPAQTLPGVGGPFRDWCYFTVAYDKNDTRICAQMTPAFEEAKVRDAVAHGVRPEIARQLGLHAQCERASQSIGPRAHYTAQLPADEATAQRLFATLGVAVPSARDLPAAEMARRYGDFLFSLWPGRPRNADQEKARTTLVNRLASLTDAISASP